MKLKVKSSDHLATIQDKAYSFEFDQMMYLLQQLSRVRGDLSADIRLMSHVHLNWPPSDIHKVSIGREINTAHELHVNFLGLAGAQGPLPITVTELLMSRVRAGDHALKDFLDLFNQRLLELLHGAHKKLNPLFDAGPITKTTYGRTLLAIAGAAGEHQSNRNAFSDRSLLAYAGLMWMQPRNAMGLEQILSHYFQISFVSEGNKGRWYSLISQDQSRLGHVRGRQNCLGKDAALGGRCWDEGFYFVLACEPLDLTAYTSFLPTGASYGALRDFLRFYVHVRARTIVRLCIKPTQCKALRLNGQSRLGWTSWLTGSSSHKRDYETQLIFD